MTVPHLYKLYNLPTNDKKKRKKHFNAVLCAILVGRANRSNYEQYCKSVIVLLREEKDQNKQKLSHTLEMSRVKINF